MARTDSSIGGGEARDAYYDLRGERKPELHCQPASAVIAKSSIRHLVTVGSILSPFFFSFQNSAPFFPSRRKTDLTVGHQIAGTLAIQRTAMIRPWPSSILVVHNCRPTADGGWLKLIPLYYIEATSTAPYRKNIYVLEHLKFVSEFFNPNNIKFLHAEIEKVHKLPRQTQNIS